MKRTHSERSDSKSGQEKPTGTPDTGAPANGERRDDAKPDPYLDAQTEKIKGPRGRKV